MGIWATWLGCSDLDLLAMFLFSIIDLDLQLRETPLYVFSGFQGAILSVELRFNLSVHNEGIATCRKTALRSVYRRRRARSLHVRFAHGETPVFRDTP